MYLCIKIRININELKQFKEIWTNLVILYILEIENDF